MSRWKKGQSGNPGGRPALPPEAKVKLRELRGEAVDKLAVLLRSKNERISLAAANSILDRTDGKPSSSETLEQRDRDELAAMTEEQLWKIAKEAAPS